MPRITETFEIITPESAEQGDAEERGYVDEEGVEIEPDDEDQTVAEAAIAFLQDKGATEASASHHTPGAADSIWYTAYDVNEGTRDWYEKGHHENRSYHLKEFTPEQTTEIARGMGVTISG
jgi:hypothetical protein